MNENFNFRESLKLSISLLIRISALLETFFHNGGSRARPGDRRCMALCGLEEEEEEFIRIHGYYRERARERERELY